MTLLHGTAIRRWHFVHNISPQMHGINIAYRCLVELVGHGAEVSCMLPHEHSTACNCGFSQVVP